MEGGKSGAGKGMAARHFSAIWSGLVCCGLWMSVDDLRRPPGSCVVLRVRTLGLDGWVLIEEMYIRSEPRCLLARSKIQSRFFRPI